MANEKELYRNRFSGSDEEKKNEIWKEICLYLNKKLGRKYNKIVDIAAGYGDFINNFPQNAEKHAVDINPDLEEYLCEGIKCHICGIEELPLMFEKESVDLFFQSNFLEHITKEQISQLFINEYSCLKVGGDMCILTPNIRYVGGKYWDFYDHITPITEKALIELAESMGFETVFCIKRFLPYTTKSKLPQSRWIVRLYLMLMPLSGMFYGEQSLILFRKK